MLPCANSSISFALGYPIGMDSASRDLLLFLALHLEGNHARAQVYAHVSLGAWAARARTVQRGELGLQRLELPVVGALVVVVLVLQLAQVLDARLHLRPARRRPASARSSCNLLWSPPALPVQHAHPPRAHVSVDSHALSVHRQLIASALVAALSVAARSQSASYVPTNWCAQQFRLPARRACLGTAQMVQGWGLTCSGKVSTKPEDLPSMVFSCPCRATSSSISSWLQDTTAHSALAASS